MLCYKIRPNPNCVSSLFKSALRLHMCACGGLAAHIRTLVNVVAIAVVVVAAIVGGTSLGAHCLLYCKLFFC